MFTWPTVQFDLMSAHRRFYSDATALPLVPMTCGLIRAFPMTLLFQQLVARIEVDVSVRDPQYSLGTEELGCCVCQKGIGVYMRLLRVHGFGHMPDVGPLRIWFPKLINNMRPRTCLDV
jgi:hypothetical protein